MLCEVVTVYGTPDSMSNQEMYSVMYWQLKLGAVEIMQVQWRRKDVGQPHQFNWEASLVVPFASGCREVSSSAGKSRGCPHVWYVGQPELLRFCQ